MKAFQVKKSDLEKSNETEELDESALDGTTDETATPKETLEAIQ